MNLIFTNHNFEKILIHIGKIHKSNLILQFQILFITQLIKVSFNWMSLTKISPKIRNIFLNNNIKVNVKLLLL